MEYKSGFVSIMGRPNVGKSTLLNQIIKEKVAITTPKAQTTRNMIRGIYNGEDTQIVFVDTPGIHKPQQLLGREMVREAWSSLESVDAAYLLIDAKRGFTSKDAEILKRIRANEIPVLMIVNKVDSIKKSELIELLNSIPSGEVEEIIPVSALKGLNIEELIATTRKFLPNDEPFYPEEQYADTTEKFSAAELIREKLMLLTEEEIPHSLAVIVDKMEFNRESVAIYASIIVEKDSQKGIVIGKNGEKLKQVGTLARKDIEHMLGKKVFLQLYVKVEKDWRNRMNALRELGFGEKDIENE